MLADDNISLLTELTELLRSDFDIVGTVGDGNALLAEGSLLKPDVVVTDIRMPGLNGIKAGRNLLKAQACKGVVILTLYEDKMLAQAAFEAGIRGYVLKMTAGDELIPAIHRIAAGGTFFSHQLRGTFFSQQLQGCIGAQL